ncbi:branched-chain amino acid transport system permease protein [Breoghania corrubedonensis]|uniref:Branched-chain amino acid transport system permease protein n=1 Tax=Breoghania corrubedonensis TaxID=665038 RepID=A0A2T5UYQ7_9HYPH|nr:branched-chain amino acid ABC transporter ATP-binding protein/permease [Breoghania corrubedonensis]PTW56620.1 branched-chain amino acid transport system permease protein [Breoghania corrubedonensis]
MSPRTLRLVAIAAVVLIAAAPFLLQPFTITLMNYIGVFALIALGLVLLTGIGGMVSFGQTAFMGIAAYSTAWVSAIMGYSPWAGLVLAIVLSGAVAAALGAITLKLQGHFLSISTVAWGIAIYFTFGNIEGLGRNSGIASIPPISVGTVALVDSNQIYYLIWAMLIGAMWLAHNMLDSRVGRAMRALRGGNSMVESLGVDAFRIRLATFVIAAILAGLSGWLYTHLGRFISPVEFDVTRGIEYLMMAMVGGAGYLAGAVVGSGLITLLKNAVQDYLPLIAPGSAGQLEIVVYSAIFILFLQRARNGIVPYIAALLPDVVHERPAEAEPLPRRTQPAPGKVLLEVEAAQKRFGGLAAVNNVSFEVMSGEILGLIGPNGAGKSTMFNLVTGAMPLSAGKVTFDGRDITRARQRKIAEAGVARTFQHVKLRPNMTLLDNVLLGTYARTKAGFFSGALGLDAAEEKRARYEAMRQLERVGLGDKPFELAGNLPLGNQRVLEIARALAADPVLLVLDEPAAGLRKQEKAALSALLKSLREEHLTILLVEHDMEFVMGLVDRIVVMEFGTKLCEGDPASVRADARVQEAYLGGVV